MGTLQAPGDRSSRGLAVKRRKSIPDRVKLIVALKRAGLTVDRVRFDHTPPLAMREWDEKAGDTIPAANDPVYIQMLTLDEDRVKTYGRGGEKRATVADGDIHKIAKMRRLTKAQEESRRRMLARDAGDQPDTPKSKWPKRPFTKRPKP